MNSQNLRTLSTEEAREIGRKGGIRSGEARRERKMMREAFEQILAMDCDFEGELMSGVEAICLATFRKALDGDVKAFQLIRDTCGETPLQRVEVERIPTERYAEIERLLLGEDD